MMARIRLYQQRSDKSRSKPPHRGRRPVLLQCKVLVLYQHLVPYLERLPWSVSVVLGPLCVLRSLYRLSSQRELGLDAGVQRLPGAVLCHVLWYEARSRVSPRVEMKGVSPEDCCTALLIANSTTPNRVSQSSCLALTQWRRASSTVRFDLST